MRLVSHCGRASERTGAADGGFSSLCDRRRAQWNFCVWKWACGEDIRSIAMRLMMQQVVRACVSECVCTCECTRSEDRCAIYRVCAKFTSHTSRQMACDAPRRPRSACTCCIIAACRKCGAHALRMRVVLAHSSARIVRCVSTDRQREARSAHFS